jgi:hypothetical protein
MLYIQSDTKKTETFEMRSGSHVQLAALRNRQPRLLVIMDQWNGQQRAVTIKMFYMFGFLQCSCFFWVTLCVYIYIYI